MQKAACMHAVMRACDAACSGQALQSRSGSEGLWNQYLRTFCTGLERDGESLEFWPRFCLWEVGPWCDLLGIFEGWMLVLRLPDSFAFLQGRYILCVYWKRARRAACLGPQLGDLVGTVPELLVEGKAASRGCVRCSAYSAVGIGAMKRCCRMRFRDCKSSGEMR